MSQASGYFRSTDASLRSKSEVDARASDERADDVLEWEPRTIDAGKRANKQGGRGAWLVRMQRAAV